MSRMGMKHRVWLKIERSVNPYNGNTGGVITPSVKQINELIEWCKENVGANGWNYYGLYREKPCEFRFKRGEDLLAFKLRFGL